MRLRAVLRRRHPGRLQPDHAPRLLPLAQRSQDAQDARCHQPPPEERGLVSNSLVYRYDVQKSADGLTGEEGPSASAPSGSSRRSRGRQARGISPHLRAHARLRQPPRALRRGDRTPWRGAGQLPAGLHAPSPSSARPTTSSRSPSSETRTSTVRKEHPSMAAQHYDAVVIGAGQGGYRSPRRSPGRDGKRP